MLVMWAYSSGFNSPTLLDCSINQGVSVFIADMLFSLVLELLFLVQVRTDALGVCLCRMLLVCDDDVIRYFTELPQV